MKRITRVKRYVVFSGVCYYPGGGWEDFNSSHDDLEEAKKLARELNKPSDAWSHVVDLETGEDVPLK